MEKTLLWGGTIIDGSGGAAYPGSLLVEQGRISAVGDITPDESMRQVDATGLCIAPGFIDTHSHSDLQVLEKPQLLPKIMQGITTELLGQDGISMAPLPRQYISDWRKNLAGLDGVSDTIDWNYETTRNYLAMIEAAKPGLNEAYLVPHGNIRMEAMGLDNRPPTADEMEKLRQITRREMEAGAFGLSTGLIYIPCAYGHRDELIEMCKVVAQFDGVFVIHQRSEADDILESMREVIDIGRQSGVRVHWSHFKVAGKGNWGKIDAVLQLLEEARQAGIEVSFDQYPYVAGSTMMGAILPPWVHDGGTNRVIERLRDEELRKKMRHDMENGLPGWDNFVDFAGFDQIFVTSVATAQNADAVGLSIAQLAEKRGKDVFETAFDLLMEEENAVGMVDFYGTEEHVKRFMKRPEMNACTDGLLAPGKPHPRLYGSFPRILGKYVREEKTLGLEEAVHKMTGKAAGVMRLPDRGLLKAGWRADICVFNPHTIADRGTYVDPVQYPQGIVHVLVNGVLAVQNGAHTGALAGSVLRHVGRRGAAGKQAQQHTTTRHKCKKECCTMNKEIINTEKAPAAIGPYVQGTKTGDFIYTSGQLGIDMETGSLAQGIEAQAHAAMKNLSAVLNQGGAGYGNVLKTTIFLQSLDDFATVNKIYESYFDGAFPARSCVQVAKLPLGGLVEIECVAVL